MLSRVFTCAVVGLEGVDIEVEVDYSNGLPTVIIVGLPARADITGIRKKPGRMHALVTK